MFFIHTFIALSFPSWHSICSQINNFHNTNSIVVPYFNNRSLIDLNAGRTIPFLKLIFSSIDIFLFLNSNKIMILRLPYFKFMMCWSHPPAHHIYLVLISDNYYSFPFSTLSIYSIMIIPQQEQLLSFLMIYNSPTVC